MGALTFRLALPTPAAEGFAWHERDGAFERLSPPWRPVRVIERTGGIRDGARVVLDLGPPAGRWQLTHLDYRAFEAFHDRQLSGPFAHYEHAHRFRDEGAPGSLTGVLEDALRWELPLAPLSAPAEWFVEREFRRLFAWRHRVTRLDLERIARVRGPQLAIGVTGASGFLGRELCAFLSTQGHRVVRFVRPRRASGTPAAPGAHDGPDAGRPGDATIAWDPARGQLAPGALRGLDAVVHLAGAGIADAPWTEARKRELIDSRVRSTATLARALAAAAGDGGPRVLVSASAVGWYGDRGDDKLTEQSPSGQGFLAGLAREWEDAAAPARAAGVRVVHPRIGIVLSPQAGALPRLALPFWFGAGGPLGDGRAWWSWISLHDLLDVLLFAIEDVRLQGPVNAVAPEPLRQRELARVLGRTLGRPALLPAPAFALRALLGREQADDMLLASTRVYPLLLQAAGFRYRDPEPDPALATMYGVPRLAASR